MRRYLNLAVAAALCAPLPAMAASAGAAIAQGGVPAAGVMACSGCHGAEGQGNPAIGAPRLAGLGRAYIVEQLDNFATGARANPIMMPMAKGLTGAQRRAVASYFSAMPRAVPAGTVPAAAPAVSLGQTLAERGRWPAGLPACAQCHGPNGVGVGPRFPPLAGLPAAYIAAQLAAWQAGKRPPGPLGLMAAVARKLSAQDIQAVSAYFAGLRVTPAKAAKP